jgi:hypothetical protein
LGGKTQGYMGGVEILCGVGGEMGGWGIWGGDRGKTHT